MAKAPRAHRRGWSLSAFFPNQASLLSTAETRPPGKKVIGRSRHQPRRIRDLLLPCGSIWLTFAKAPERAGHRTADKQTGGCARQGPGGETQRGIRVYRYAVIGCCWHDDGISAFRASGPSGLFVMPTTMAPAIVSQLHKRSKLNTAATARNNHRQQHLEAG